MPTPNSSSRYAFRRVFGFAAGVAAIIAMMPPLGAQTGQAPQNGQAVQAPIIQPPPTGCRVTGHATASGSPLPGVAIGIKGSKGSTSTDVDGSFGMTLTPGTYTLNADLTGFGHVERSVTIGEPTPGCAQTADFVLTLAPKDAPINPQPAAPDAAKPTTTAPTQQAAAASNATPPNPAPGRGGRGAAAGGANARNGRGGQPTLSGFQTLDVQQSGDAAAAETPASANETEAATRSLLPPGFSADSSGDAIAISGNNGSVDRGALNDRFGAIGRGEFDPNNPPQFGPGGDGGQGQGGFGGRGGPGGPGGGRGGPGGPGRDGGRGGFGGFLGGRGAQQNRYQGSVNYTFGGSALNAQPFQLQNGQSVPAFEQNSYGATIGGPVKIPGLYDGTRKTNFVVTYNGTHNNNLFDQYASVPTLAERAGDFSSQATSLINPTTGLPFVNNQIPAAMFSQAAQTLLRFIPQPNVATASPQNNYHASTNYGTASDNISVRVTQNFTPAINAQGAPGGRGGGFGGGRGGGRNQTVQGWSVNMTAQLQYRRNDNDSENIDPLLGGHTASRSLAIPVSFNIRHKRTMHNLSINFSRTSSSSTNHFSGIENVAAEAGILTGVTNPFDYGVPTLSFAGSGFNGVRDLVPSNRNDQRVSVSYSWVQPWKTHLFRAGGDVRIDHTNSETDASPNGNFVFSGVYSGNDFADFLLGMPQTASQQYGPTLVRLRDKSGDVFLNDDWRFNSKLTFNLGLRYELTYPFTSVGNQLYDLDVNSTFTQVAPVQAGQTGPFFGQFPVGILRPDTNNLAPAVGFAWRINPGLVARGGYRISYNSGSYSNIARQLAAQPPAAYSFTNSYSPNGLNTAPLFIGNVLNGASTTVLQNNYGVDPNYQLGRVQTFNVDLQKDLTQAWLVGGGYVRTTGSNLDIVRAPNRAPTGLKIDTIQAFNYQTSQGISVLNAGTFRLQRRMVKGIGGSVTYTLAKSMDNASNIGGGGTQVAQNDQDLAAEYSLSSFDRRHQINGNVSFELPFGPNKPWLHDGGLWAALLGGWRGAANYLFQTGTPLTPIFTGGLGSIANGSSGSLRADVVPGVPLYSGLTGLEVFNPAAFAAPPPGQYGNAGRNSITGPNNSTLNAQFSRDIRMKNNRTWSLQANLNNILNTENFAGVYVNLSNPLTFGTVSSFRPARSATLNLRFRF